MIRRLELMLCAALTAGVLASAAASTAQSLTGPVVVTVGPIANGRLDAIGYPPDFQVGCHTSRLVAQLIIEMGTRSAFGIVQSECGVQWTLLPAGSCTQVTGSHQGFTCASSGADGMRRFASTDAHTPTRGFGFSEISSDVWFQVSGIGAGAG